MKQIGFAFFVSMMLLAGCGQKGPLFLPEDGSQQTQQK
ncbi:MAG: LPS translocon maturation chaperone LptM [Pontibacterium sp.]